MTSRMVGSVLTLVILLFSVVGGAAQTYTQIQWGMNKGVTPYAFGANINGTWRDLGTVSAAGTWAIPGSNITFTQAGAGAVSQTVTSKLYNYIDLDDYKSPSDASDCPALTKAIAANAGAVIKLPPRVVTLGTVSTPCNITISSMVQIEGSGWQVTTASGTVLSVVNATGNPFTISGDAARGTTFRNLAIKQTQPNPSVGWTPTVYPAIFNVNTSDIHFENIMAWGVYQFINATDAGRLNIDSVYGQVFNNFLTLDTAYDSPRITNIHLWPFWSADPNIMAYQQANTKSFIFKRTDSAFVDKIFVYANLTGLEFSSSVAGVTTKFSGGAITCDLTKYCIDSVGNDVQGNIDNLEPDAQLFSAPGSGIPGARGFRIAGTGSSWTVGALNGTWFDSEVVEMTSSTISSNLQIDKLRCWNYNLSNSGAGCVKDLGTANTMWFSQQPTLVGGYGTWLVMTGTAPTMNTQRNTVANRANFAVTTDSATGNPVSYSVAGNDADISLNLAAKGSGAINLNSATNITGTTTIGALTQLTAPFSWSFLANGATAGYKRWDMFQANSGVADVTIRALDDTYTAANNVMVFSRVTDYTQAYVTMNVTQLTGGTAPTIACTGGTTTGASVAADSTSNAGQFTTAGPNNTACTITYAAKYVYPNRSFCVVSPANSGAAAITTYWITTTASTFVLNHATSLGTNTVWNYHCDGN